MHIRVGIIDQFRRTVLWLLYNDYKIVNNVYVLFYKKQYAYKIIGLIQFQR